MYKLFLLDMDGVLLRHKSSWGYCQEAIGFDQAHFYDEFGQDILDGKDLVDLVMQKMARHGFTESKLQELARNAPQMNGVGKVLTAVHAAGASAFIISGGIGAFAQVLSEQYPITGYVCNELHFDRPDLPPRCDIKVGHEDKGKVARRIIAEMGVDKEEVVAIGDYGNDCAMFELAGLSIAFNGDQQAKAAATHNIESDDLSDILRFVL